MDAIKKKMHGMKLEKDNAMDKADACEAQAKERALLCEQQARDANARAEKVNFQHFQIIIIQRIKTYDELRIYK